MIFFAYMAALRLQHHWQLADATLPRVDPALLELLAAIERHGSLQGAARELDVSYRHAWSMVGASAKMLGAALVKLERGRGAALTALGHELVRLDHKVQQQLAPHYARLEHELETAVRQHARAPAALVVHASHDLALAYLRDLARHARRPLVDLHFRGSIESLESFSRGTCDVAGFHVPEKLSAALARRYARWLSIRPAQLIHFVDRQQGLVVARGNSKRIRRLSDLTRPGVRFINRQPGSGTRLLFDELLQVQGIAPQRINGYQTEEFTHGAVAAMIASGIADAGFAVEAAARQHGLDFVPIARERYYLIARPGAANAPAISALIELLRGRKFKSYVSRLAGYGATRCGEPAAIDDVLRAQSEHA